MANFSASVFLRHEGRVLLVAHKKLQRWLPVGGKLIAGELPIEAARREVREETGLEPVFPYLAGVGVPGSPMGFLGYAEHQTSAGMFLDFAFVADVCSRYLRPDGSWEHSLWVDPKQPLRPSYLTTLSVQHHLNQIANLP